MKNLIISLLFVLVLFVVQTSQAQDSFYGKVYFGVSDAFMFTNLDGAANYEIENFQEFGFQVGKELNKRWAIETGLNFAAADYYFDSNFPGENSGPKERFQMYSFPVLVKYSLFPFLYLSGGPMLDFQNSDKTSFDQSGIGFQVGIGAQHYFNNVGIFVQPHFKRHSAISFDSSVQNLVELGVQFGVAHKF